MYSRPAYRMIPSGTKRDDLQLRLGLKLYEMGMQESSRDWILFSAADHLNATSLQVETHDPVFLIKLNLQVAERASSVAAYKSATKFLGMARQFLSKIKNPWEKCYDFSLRVYRATVEAELCLGHFDVGMAAGQTLLSRATSLEDKLPTYLSICRAFGRREQHKEAYDMSIDVLRIMEAIPKGGIGVMRLVEDIVYAKRFFARHSDTDILAIPMLKDKRLETTLELWSVAEINAFYCGATLNHLVTIFRGLVVSLKKGLSPQCGVNMSGYSLICSAMDDMKGAHRISHLARQILDMTKAREQACVQLFIAGSFIHAWQDPPAQIIELYDRAHKLGMESGDFEHGLLCQVGGYQYAFITGHSLADLEMKYISVMKKLHLYKIKSVQAMSEENLLAIQYLRGTAKKDFDATLLSKYGPTDTLDNVSERFRLTSGYFARLELAVYFNEDDLALRCLEGLDLVTTSSDVSFVGQSVRLCFSSLAYSTLYRNRRKRSYLNKSKRCLRALKRICRIKGKVCWYRCMLMEVHLEAVKGRHLTSIPVAFDRAIEAASDKGYDHDAALGSQLAAEYCLCVMQGIHKDSKEYTSMNTLLRQYLQQAIDLYKSWGAIAVAYHLENKHGSFLIEA